MSSSVQGPGGAGEDMDQDVELNIASIVDCFTVLITYLLAASSFITIGGLEAGLASSGVADTEQTARTPLFLAMEMTDTRTIRLKSSGAETQVFEFPAEQGKWNLQAAIQEMKNLKERNPGLESLTLLPENGVQYQDIIAAISATKKALPIFFVKTESL